MEGGQRSLVQMICSAQHRGVACYSAELQLCNAVLQHLEFGGWGHWGGGGVYILMCPFFLGRWCEGKHGCVGGGASTEIKKRVPIVTHNPLAWACGK